jgi:hypothetical protein
MMSLHPPTQIDEYDHLLELVIDFADLTGFRICFACLVGYSLRDC